MRASSAWNAGLLSGNLQDGLLEPPTTSIVTFWSTLAQAPSAVRTGNPVMTPSARQARSPSDKPKDLVFSSSAAERLACSISNGRISPTILQTSASTDEADMPRRPRIVATSATLTADMIDRPRCGATRSAPGSFRRTVSSAEASSTTLPVDFGIPPAFLNEFPYEIDPGADRRGHFVLKLLESQFGREEMKASAVHLENEFLAGCDAEALAAFRRDAQPAFLIHLGAIELFHFTIPINA